MKHYNPSLQPKSCCAYGSGKTAGVNAKGYDCVEIPNAEKVANGALVNDRICGRVFVSASGNTAATICCE